MSERLTIATAGNVLPAALAALRDLGYRVTLTNNGRLCKAEVDDYLAFHSDHVEAAYQRADAWEASGAVHVICVSAFGDPVELGEDEARDFSIRLPIRRWLRPGMNEGKVRCHAPPAVSKPIQFGA